MPKFIHASYMGSYYVKCKIIKEYKNTYRIEFVDPVSEETLKRSLPKKDVKK